MNNLTLRAISGALFVALVVVCLLGGTWPAWGMLLLFSFLSLREYQNLLLPNLSFIQKLLFIISGCYLFAVLSFKQFMYYSEIPPVFYYVTLLLPVLVFISELFRKNAAPFDQIGRQLTGWIYIPVSLGLLFGTGYQPFLYVNGEIAYNGFLVLTIFILIWSNDTFAYLTGRWLGKKTLFSRISPKKTVEGSIGGLILTIASAIAIYYLHPQLTLIQYILLAITISFSATLGDLVESMLKRSLDIKDSGNLIPGHGGILDRLDATLLTAWFVYFLLQIF